MVSTTLGVVLESSGGSVKTGPFGTKLSASEYADAGSPVISVGEVGYGTITISDRTKRVDLEVVERLPEYLLMPGDIVFGRKGAVDRSAWVRPHEAGYFLGSDGIRIRFGPGVDSRFMAYQLGTQRVKNWLLQHAIGTTLASLNEPTLKALPVDVPPLSVQRGIAARLGVLDDKIESNRRCVELLHDLNQLRVQALNRDQSMTSHSRVTTLGELEKESEGLIQTGPFGSQLHMSDYSDTGTPVVMPTNIRDLRIDPAKIARVSADHVERLARHKLQPGDIIYSRRGDVEKCALIGKTESGWLCGTGCLLVRVGGRNVDTRFLAYSLSQQETRAWITRRAVGATMPNLNTSILREIPVLLPPINAQRAAVHSSLDDKINSIRAEISLLAELRNALLPELLSGRIRVPEAQEVFAEVGV